MKDGRENYVGGYNFECQTRFSFKLPPILDIFFAAAPILISRHLFLCCEEFVYCCN